MSSQVERRKLIVDEFLKNPNSPCRLIAKSVKMSKTTVAKVIKAFKERQTVQRKSGSGGATHFKYKNKYKFIIKSFNEKSQMSVRERAKHYKISKSQMHRIMRKHDFKCFRVQKAPNRNEKQNLTARSRARKLSEKMLTNFNGCLLLDDETYVKKDFKQLPGVSYYVSKVRGKVAGKYRKVLLDKFAPKVMIWQAICSCGMKSKPHAVNGTMKTEDYIKCLKKGLLPVIKAHRGKPVIFWPDLASIHYAKDTKIFYNNNNIKYVPKEYNPPNTPELRSIERFWAIIKGNLRKKGVKVTTPQQLLRNWNNATKFYGISLVHDLMAGLKTKIRKFWSTPIE